MRLLSLFLALYAVADATSSSPLISPPAFVKTQRVAEVPRGGDEATAEVAPSVFNLVNNVAGAGLLTLAAGMAKGTGWIPSLLTCCALGTASGHTFNLIGESCRLTGEGSFKGVWSKTLGDNTYVIDLIVALMCTGASIIYSGILGDVSKELLSTVGIETDRSKNILMITVGVLFPLSLIKNLSALAFTSVLGFASIVYTVLFIIFRSLDGTYGPLGKFIVDDVIKKPDFSKSSLLNFDFTTLVLMSNLGLAYIAHYNAPTYYREMRDKTQFKKMVMISFSILTLLYAAVMAAGYATFGDICEGNILLNYHPSDFLSTLGRVATGVSILFGFPLAFCGCTAGMMGVAERFDVKTVLNNRTGLIATLLALVTYISIAVPDISLIVGVVGAAMGSLIVYILPALIYTKAVALNHGKGSAEYKKSLKNLALIPFGLMFAILGVGMTVKESLDK